jgi:hypothetical protein
LWWKKGAGRSSSGITSSSIATNLTDSERRTSPAAARQVSEIAAAIERIA